MAEHVIQNHRGVLAVLAYGSTLRDVSADESLIDLYVLTECLAGVSSNLLSRLGCALVPPNVYYGECRHGGEVYRAKYACLPLRQFEHRISKSASNPYFWARFSQPSRIVWVRDAQCRSRLITALQQCIEAATANARAIAPGEPALAQWITLFQNTYRTELRPESAARAEQIVEANASYYESAQALCSQSNSLSANWALRRLAGKSLSVLRLIKAAFTFQGGADYIAWKIKRHSGVEITVAPWQRKHPLLAGVFLLPQLLRKGAVK